MAGILRQREREKLEPFSAERMEEGKEKTPTEENRKTKKNTHFATNSDGNEKNGGEFDDAEKSDRVVLQKLREREKPAETRIKLTTTISTANHSHTTNKQQTTNSKQHQHQTPTPTHDNEKTVMRKCSKSKRRKILTAGGSEYAPLAQVVLKKRETLAHRLTQRRCDCTRRLRWRD